jgi:hypothetical protein
MFLRAMLAPKGPPVAASVIHKEKRKAAKSVVMQFDFSRRRNWMTANGDASLLVPLLRPLSPP